MSSDQIILFAIFGAVVVLLVWGRWRYDLVAFAGLLAAVVTGVLPAEKAFEGFGNEATIVVALVLVVSAGLVNAGAVQVISRTVTDAARGLGAHVATMGAVGAVLSAFMNNVAALALLMPLDMQAAKKAGRDPGLSLMPLSFATILGGMVTLIGTPPNIIIAAYRGEVTGEPFAMFDFAPVGLAAAAAGLAFVALAGWRLIPHDHRGGAGAAARLAETTTFIAELVIPEGSAHEGRKLADLETEAEQADAALIGLIRDRQRLRAPRRATLKAGDRIVVDASAEALDELRAALKLDYAEGSRQEAKSAEGLTLSELVVSPQSRLVGRTAQAVGLSWRQQAILTGISRQGRRISRQVRQTEIRAGDILLVLVPSDTRAEVADWMGCLPLAERERAITQTGKTWLAVGSFAGAILAASLGLIPLPVALGLVTSVYAFSGIVPPSDLYRQIEWPVVVLLGSMIPLGQALHEAGGTALIVDGLLALTLGWPVWAVLTVLMVAVMSLSDVLNNTATAIVAGPVAVSMAERLEANADPFLMSVAVAASCAFLTPIGHKNNTLVMGPGGYRFGDYWRMGLPLEVLIVAVSIPAIMLFWPPV